MQLAIRSERNRRGRKRQVGVPRDKYGRAVQTEVSVMGVALSQPHRRGLPVEVRPDGTVHGLGRDPRAENPLGRFSLSGAIDRLEYEAGLKFAKVFAAHRSVIGSRNPLMQSQPGMSRPVPLIGKELEAYEDRAHKAMFAFQAARLVLERAGSDPHFAVHSVAVYEEDLDPLRIPYLVCGLKALAKHFGLDKAK